MASFSPEFREEVYKFAEELSAKENASRKSGDGADKPTAQLAKNNKPVVPVESDRHYHTRSK